MEPQVFQLQSFILLFICGLLELKILLLLLFPVGVTTGFLLPLLCGKGSY